MELSLSMWSVHRTVRQSGWTVLDFLSFCKEEGIQQVELLNVFWKDIQNELPEVIAFTKANGIRVVSYAVANDFVKTSPDERAAALVEITDAYPVAKALGTSIVRVFSGNRNDDVAYEDGLEWIINGLSQAAKLAEAEGIMLCLENHGVFAGSGEQVRHILESVGSHHLRSTFDTGNFLLVDEQPEQALQDLLPYVAHVHVKDFYHDEAGRYHSLSGKTYEGTPLGEGDVELQAIIQRLNATGYQGAFVLEYEGIGSEAVGIRKSYDNFKAIAVN